MENLFDDIRPYNNEEINGVLNELTRDPEFEPILYHIFKEEKIVEAVKADLNKLTSIIDFQVKFMYPLIKDILVKSTDGVFCTGIENLEKDKNYLFISNHRDIILDSAFMNMLMHDEGLKTTEIAIGSNLLISDWITRIVRTNRAFIVKRNIPIKQMLEASRKLSAYIRNTITVNDRSVWIAQREGRTKDGNDQTQVALLKMINVSNKKSFAEGFKDLHVVPLSISYEIEPCGNEKVLELLLRSEDSCFQKTPKDDMLAMAGGLKNAKGKVNFSFGKPISGDLLKEIETKCHGLNERLNALASHIDQNIYSNYKLWPNNYIAYDIHNKTTKYFDLGEYTQEQKEAFLDLMNTRLELLGDRKEAGIPLWMNMYAYPVTNHENTLA
ncbi:MAG: 1-acyl-sn-glycerol-3-phosphate acyltransferase [Bacteroidota bacterium]|nr:1-acyl-sn-glycerol-3-phosphate acyltransferase [Bacteroidota bacterium]